MRAHVQNVRKETLQRFDGELERNVPTLMVVVDVNFETDAGHPHSSQTYAFLPDEVDFAFPQRQADAMQQEFDHAKQVKLDEAIRKEQHAAADSVIDKFCKQHKLPLGDSLKVEDERGAK